MPSGILWPHSVYGGKALPWRHNNFQPKMQSTEAPVGLHGDPAVEMKLQYNELMMAYIKERIDQPYDGDRTTARYVAASIAVLESTARALPASNADLTEALEDALLLSKCFAATVLAPPLPAERSALFLEFVHAVQPDMSRFQPETERAILSAPGEQPLFWSLLRHYVLVGRLPEAGELLASRSNPQLDALLQLIETYPLQTPKQSRFMRWRQDALALLDNITGGQEPGAGELSAIEIERVVLLLVGDTGEVLRSADNWVEALCGLTLYSDPTFESLGVNFTVAYEKLGLKTMPTWEEGCRALFEDRVVAALASLKLLDVGTAVVFSEFCHEKNLLRKYAGLPNAGIREELGLEYVHELLASPRTVEIGLEMLANINSDAARATAEDALPDLVQRLPETVETAVETAGQLGLVDLETSLCRTAARAHWEAHNYIAALRFFFQASDYTMLSECSWDLFEQILVTQAVPGANEATVDVLEDFSAAEALELPVLIRDNLAPAAVLLQLLTAVHAGDVSAAVTNLRGLLTLPSKIEYHPLLVALLANAAPLTTMDTALLMGALDTWDRNPETWPRTRELIEAAAKEPAWAESLAAESPEDYDNAVWFLRRQLARSLVL